MLFLNTHYIILMKYATFFDSNATKKLLIIIAKEHTDPTVLYTADFAI